jgi:methanogenic corrinoid protein MtbC1
MNACDPNADLGQLRNFVKQNTGITVALNKSQLCKVYRDVQDEKWVLPPMVLNSDRTWLLDRKSPLNAREYERLLDSKSTKSQIMSLAKKVGASIAEKATKAEVIDSIYSKLKSLDILEPIQIAKVRRQVVAPTKGASNVVDTEKMVNINLIENENEVVNNVKVGVNTNNNVGVNTPRRNNVNIGSNTPKNNLGVNTPRMNNVNIGVTPTPRRNNVNIGVTPRRNNVNIGVTPRRNNVNIGVTPRRRNNVNIGVTPRRNNVNIGVTPRRNNVNIGVTPKRNNITPKNNTGPKKNNTVPKNNTPRKNNVGPMKSNIAPASVKVVLPPPKNNSEIMRLQRELNAARVQLAKQNMTPQQKNNAQEKLNFAKIAFEQRQIERKKLKNSLETFPHLSNTDVMEIVAEFDRGSVLANLKKKAGNIDKKKADEKKAIRESMKNIPDDTPQKFEVLQTINKPRVDIDMMKNLIAQLRSNKKDNAIPVIQTKKIQTATQLATVNIPADIKKELEIQLNAASNSSQVAKIGVKIKNIAALNNRLNKTGLNNAQKRKLLIRVKQGENLVNVQKNVNIASPPKKKKGFLNFVFGEVNKKTNAVEKVQKLNIPPEVKKALNQKVVSAGNNKQVEQVEKKIENVKKLNAVLNKTPTLNNAQKKNALNRVVAGESVNAVKNSLKLPKKKPGFFSGLFGGEKAPAQAPAQAPAPVQNKIDPKALLRNKIASLQKLTTQERNLFISKVRSMNNVDNVFSEAANLNQQKHQQAVNAAAAKAQKAQNAAERKAAEAEQRRLENEARRANARAKREEQLLKKQARKNEERAKQNRFTSIMRNANVDRAYLNRYLVGKNINAINMANLKAKASKDRELARLIANSKGTGMFGGKYKPVLKYVDPSNYNRQYQAANTKLKNLQNATKEKNIKKRLMSIGRVNMSYINAYKGEQSYEEINTTAFKNKVQKDMVVAKKVQQARNDLFPKIVYIKPEEYNNKLANANRQLANIEEKRRVNAEDKAAVDALLKGAGVDMAYLKAFAGNKNVKTVDLALLKEKAAKDKVVQNTLNKVKGPRKSWFGKAKLVYIAPNRYNAELNRARKMLENKQAGEAAAVEATRLSKEEDMLLKKLSRNAGVDAKYVRAYAKSTNKKFRNVNLANLQAKKNKDMVIAQERVRGKSFLGKPSKPTLEFVPNAVYNARLAQAKKEANNREAKTQASINATKGKVEARNALMKLASNSQVSTKYVSALLKNRGISAKNLTKNALNKKINANRIVATEKAKGKTFLGKPVKPTLVYIPNKNYNATVSKAVANAKARQNKAQASINAKKGKVEARNALMKLASNSQVNTKYISALLKNRGISAKNLTKNVLNKKINANRIVATEKAKGKTFLGKPVKPTLVYIPNKNYNAVASKAVSNAKARENKAKAAANSVEKKKADEAHMNQLLKTVGGRRTPGKGGQFTKKNIIALAKAKTRGNVRRVNIQMLRNMNAENLKKFEAKGKAKTDRANFEKQLKAKGLGMLQRGKYMKRYNAGEPVNSILKSVNTKNNANKKIANMAKKYGIGKNFILDVAKKLGKAPENLTEFELQQQKKNVKKMASAKQFPVKTAEMLGKQKTALVQKIQKSIPGAFGQFRRAWESEVRQAANTKQVENIERLLNEKVKLRGEIEAAKITDKQRKGHLRWVMQKRNDVAKRRAELAKHKETFGKNLVATTTPAKEDKPNAKANAKTGALSLNAAKAEIRKMMAKKKVSVDSAYKRLSLKYHPNKGGTKANFVTLQSARNALKREPVAVTTTTKPAATTTKALPAPTRALTLENKGVRSKLNSKYYDKLTKAERDAFYKRWFDKKNKTIWAEARKIQKQRANAAKATPAAKAFANAGKKRELAGRLRLAAKKSVAQNIKKANIGVKNKNKMLKNLKLKKTKALDVQKRLKTKKTQVKKYKATRRR